MILVDLLLIESVVKRIRAGIVKLLLINVLDLFPYYLEILEIDMRWLLFSEDLGGTGKMIGVGNTREGGMALLRGGLIIRVKVTGIDRRRVLCLAC